MEEQVLQYSEIKVYVDKEGREIHEMRPVNYTDKALYAAYVPMVMNQFGATQSIRLILRNAQNLAEAFKLHDTVLAKLQEDMAAAAQAEAAKPKLVLADDAPMGVNKLVL